MTTTLSLVPIQALSTTNADGIQMSGPYILVRATTVAQQVQATRQLGKKPISPSPKEPEALRCKRRTDSNGLHNILPRPQPAAVARRNERERNRVKLVNTGFDTLREHVPFGKKNKKMSKVDTLKAASDYIKYLQEILTGETENVSQLSDMIVDSSDSNSGDERLTGEDITDMNDLNSSMQNNNNNNNNVFTTLQNSEQLNNFSFCAALNDNTTFTFAQSPTVSGSSSQNSPAPSMTSDAISESFSSEDEELPDLGSWFS